MGRRGLPAGEVGHAAADALIEELELPGNADRHLADQLMIYVALCGGHFTTSRLTQHSQTMCWLLERFGLSLRITEKQGGETEVRK